MKTRLVGDVQATGQELWTGTTTPKHYVKNLCTHKEVRTSAAALRAYACLLSYWDLPAVGDSQVVHVQRLTRHLGADEAVFLKTVLHSATSVSRLAQARYSGFKVGASLVDGDGTITHGVNVESASFGCTICAERSALVSALAQGRRGFCMLAVYAESSAPVPPCGACRQLLFEYCPDAVVVMLSKKRTLRLSLLRELLPFAFDARVLDGGVDL